jgi:hypothetical protein
MTLPKPAAMNYGANIPDGWRQVGVFAGRILKGATPVVRRASFELVINAQTAGMLGPHRADDATRQRRRGG